MTGDPTTPIRGIRLKGDAPIPPAPGWGIHRPVTLHDTNDRHIGAIVEITSGHHVPVCVHDECLRALPARPSYFQGRKALRDHWGEEHGGGAP